MTPFMPSVSERFLDALGQKTEVHSLALAIATICRQLKMEGFMVLVVIERPKIISLVDGCDPASLSN